MKIGNQKITQSNFDLFCDGTTLAIVEGKQVSFVNLLDVEGGSLVTIDPKEETVSVEIGGKTKTWGFIEFSETFED